MAEIGTITYKVSLDTSDLKNQLNKVDQTIKSTTEKTSDNVAKHLDEIPKSVNKTAKNTSTILTSVLGSVIERAYNKIADSITNSLDGAINRVDALSNFPKVMQSLGYSADEAGSSISIILYP